jgi:hypothetical protein
MGGNVAELMAVAQAQLAEAHADGDDDAAERAQTLMQHLAGRLGGGGGRGGDGGLGGLGGGGGVSDAERAHAQEIMQEMSGHGDDPFGAGQQQWGQQYQAKSRFGEFVDTFTTLICTAQEFVRQFHAGERSSASLRDVARCIKVYRWFGEHITKQEEKKGAHQQFSRIDFFSVKPKARRAVRDAVIMSIAYCYHSRLPRDERAELRERLTDAWADLQVPPSYTTFGWRLPGKECCAWLDLSGQ